MPKKGLWITPQPVFAVLFSPASVHRRQEMSTCRSPGSGIMASDRLPGNISSDLLNFSSSLTVAGPHRILTCFPLSRFIYCGTHSCIKYTLIILQIPCFVNRIYLHDSVFDSAFDSVFASASKSGYRSGCSAISFSCNPLYSSINFPVT